MGLISIATWNTQGSPLNNDDKEEILKSISQEYNYILLQECGSLANSLNFGSFQIYSSKPAGAFCDRCSTAILSKNILKSGKAIDMSTGREGIWISDNGVYIAAIHCTANGTAQDRSYMLKAMNKIAGESPLIIGGDFNTSPPDDPYLNVGTQFRPIWFNVDSQSQPTQKSGKILDYFVSRNVQCGSVRKYRTKVSDHHAVTATYQF
ncbi:MAG: endonuclease/exonuclease/phosphatase family protein [Candidatus Hodarchaeales archaeon]